jgi:hypothetical protein
MQQAEDRRKNKFFRFSACFGVDKGVLWRYTNKAAF